MTDSRWTFIPSSERQYKQDNVGQLLVSVLESLSHDSDTGAMLVYYGFPIYRAEDGTTLFTKLTAITQKYGIFILETSAQRELDVDSIRAFTESLTDIHAALHARLVKNRSLRTSATSLLVSIRTALFAPSLIAPADDVVDPDALPILRNVPALQSFVLNPKVASRLTNDQFEDVAATLEGAKGLMRPPRQRSMNPASKGAQVAALEAAITKFDLEQRIGYITEITAPQRIRGLAGTGKTVVLCMKAALTHIRDPNATLLYTFHTKTLYQQIKRLITRFYRQFDDRDPNWERVRILHGWGGATMRGVYSTACMTHRVNPLTFRQAAMRSPRDPFGYACSVLMEAVPLMPLFDYSFIDEGQDFPSSFLRLCAALTRSRRFVWAYDELQTIFQAQTPNPDEVFGTTPEGQSLVTLENDIVLHKCYRNPREVLVCAHALGLGIYGPRIAQLPEDIEYWSDIGYEVRSGEYETGSQLAIERPPENSLDVIRGLDLVSHSLADSYNSEVIDVVESILLDIRDGLRPDDILVIIADDVNLRKYAQDITDLLHEHKMSVNDLRADPFGFLTFSVADTITITSVHLAKGNEAYRVYVVGVDALFAAPTVRERNMLFAAMTRAKAWVQLSGVGDAAAACFAELDRAKSEYPYLRFAYPSKQGIRMIRRDLREVARRKQEAERLLDSALAALGPEELAALLKQRMQKRGISKSRGPGTGEPEK